MSDDIGSMNWEAGADNEPELEPREQDEEAQASQCKYYLGQKFAPAKTAADKRTGRLVEVID